MRTFWCMHAPLCARHQIRACAVAFYLPEQLAAESTEPTILEELPSDRFRLIAADEDGTWEELDELGQPLKKVVPLDENTGLGGWETVAVVEIDEEAESAAREEAQRKAAKKKEEKKMRQEKLKEIEDHAQLDGDDAMSSYDPWGTGLYKGIALEDQVGEVLGGVEENSRHWPCCRAPLMAVLMPCCTCNTGNLGVEVRGGCGHGHGQCWEGDIQEAKAQRCQREEKEAAEARS